MHSGFRCTSVAFPSCDTENATSLSRPKLVYAYKEYYTTMKNIVKRNVKGEPDLKAIGRRIREIRGFDMNQSEFGRLFNVGQAQLSKYEMGLSSPTLEFLLALKRYSGRTIDWIVTGEKADGPQRTAH
jgi:DNA-binding transcriptional regulator YiaG